jgi:hypothetical protein
METSSNSDESAVFAGVRDSRCRFPEGLVTVDEVQHEGYPARLD